MPYYVELQNKGNYPLSAQRITAAAETVLCAHSRQDGSALTIVVTTNEAVQELNLRHRAIDAPTDVLSFPADAPPIEIPDEAPYLGDLVIAYPYALQQAQQAKIDVDDSFILLVVHGTLHLLGYDHDGAEKRAEMWSIQADMLKKMGISPEIVPVLES